MRRKILASDFDGTLCQNYSAEGYPATAEVLEAIRQFRKDGGLFGVVTGRDWRWSWKELDENGKLEFDFIICLNGAQVYDRAGELLDETAVESPAEVDGKPMVQALAEACWELAGKVVFINCGKDRYYFSPDLPEGGEWDGDTYAPHAVLKNIDRFNMFGAVADNNEKGLVAAAELEKKFGAYVHPIPAGRTLDIPPVGVNKGLAVALYAEKMGVAKEDIWTAGDNYNDIDMLKAFHGCAMERGVQAAKDAAEFVCKDLAEVIAQIRKSDM